MSRIGGEFLPQMNEGDLLYMPSALPGISPAEAGRLLADRSADQDRA
jgi:Cu(I)/Ag(I) efflux system membrane protein CusA/SilA